MRSDEFIAEAVRLLRELRPGVGIIKLHERDDGPPVAYLVEADHLMEIADLVPEGPRATDLFMSHEHLIAGEEDDPND